MRLFLVASATLSLASVAARADCGFKIEESEDGVMRIDSSYAVGLSDAELRGIAQGDYVVVSCQGDRRAVVVRSSSESRPSPGESESSEAIPLGATDGDKELDTTNTTGGSQNSTGGSQNNKVADNDDSGTNGGTRPGNGDRKPGRDRPEGPILGPDGTGVLPTNPCGVGALCGPHYPRPEIDALESAAAVQAARNVRSWIGATAVARGTDIRGGADVRDPSAIATVPGAATAPGAAVAFPGAAVDVAGASRNLAVDRVLGMQQSTVLSDRVNLGITEQVGVQNQIRSEVLQQFSPELRHELNELPRP